MKPPLGIFVFAMALAACSAQQPAPNALKQQDLNRMMSWLEGEWDNAAQVRRQVAQGVPEDERHIRYAMRYTPIQAPAIKGQLFAIENYKAGTGFEGQIERVSLHRFFLNDDKSEIVHEILFLNDRTMHKSLIGNLSALTNLREDAFSTRPGCRLFWTWTQQNFTGATRSGACVTDSYTDEPITVEGFGTLKENELHRHDRNYAMNGCEIKRPGYREPEEFIRIN